MYHQYNDTHSVRGGGRASTRRGKRSSSSGQTVVYQFCSTEQQAIACVLFINDNASMILASVSAPLAPLVSVSCAHTLRDILAGRGSGVLEPDAKCKHLPNAKAHLPGFCICYSSSTGVLHVEPVGSYHAQFHWHEGDGRLTLDPVSARTAAST